MRETGVQFFRACFSVSIKPATIDLIGVCLFFLCEKISILSRADAISCNIKHLLPGTVCFMKRADESGPWSRKGDRTL